MKKRGFTLIELLAVIVVLAIIALILVPIVTNTIKNAEKGSAEIATQNYIRAVELAISNSDLNRKTVKDGSYTIDSEGNLTGADLPGGKLEIDASGDRPTGGTIVIKDGQVTTDSTITVGDYDVVYNPTSKSYEATEKGSMFAIYRYTSEIINIGDTIDPTKYTTDPATLKNDYYLKHVLDKNNKVIESYACANYTSSEGNDVACLRGGGQEYKIDNKPILDELQEKSGVSYNDGGNGSYRYYITPDVVMYVYGNLSNEGVEVKSAEEMEFNYCEVKKDNSSRCVINH